MTELFQIACPGCGTVFELPAELGGELGECTECDAIFEIPKLDAVESGNLETTDTGAIKVSESADSESTNTVKLSRTSIGMLPDVKDNFSFDVIAKNHSKKPALPPKRKSFKNKTTVRRPANKSTRKRPPAKPKKKWWQFWK